MEERRFRAMGTDVHVVVVGGTRQHATAAQARLAELERRWSRFLPDSELSLLNRSGGRTMALSEDTCRLLDAMLAGHALTAGLFDPSVHDALVAAGYDRSFERLGLPGPAGPTTVATSTPGLAGLELDRRARRARLGGGLRLDPGGIGKGLAADLVTDRLLGAGVAGVSVNVGGDLRVAGEPPDGVGWGIELEGPDGAGVGLVGLTGGAVATSTTALRRWVTGGEERHHVIDPRTALPAVSDLASVAVVAATAWSAEVLATAALLAGRDRAPAVLEAGAGHGLLVGHDGRHTVTRGMEEYLW